MTVQTRRITLPRLLPLLSLSILLLAGCGEKKRPISGEIPPVHLETFSGEAFTLDAGQKDATLLVFWASWCGPCLMEIPALIKLHEKYRDKNFQVIGVNVDDPGALPKAKGIASEYGINYPTLIGNQETMRVFGNVNALPTSFLIGKDGRIRQKFQGLRSEEELEAHILELLANKG